MISITQYGRKKAEEIDLPFILASISRVEGKLNGQDICIQGGRLVFYQREEKAYLAFICRIDGRGRPNRVTKIFNLSEDEKFNFIHHGRSLFFTLSLSIGQLRIYCLNERLDISQGVDEKFVVMIEEAITATEKKKNRTSIIRKKPRNDGGEL